MSSPGSAPLSLFADWARQCAEALLVLDADGHVALHNDAAARLFGAAPVDLHRRPFAELLHRAGAAATDAILTNLFDPKTEELELRLRVQGEPPRHIHLRLTRWSDARGPWLGLIAEDRSRRRRDEEELTQLASFPELDPNPIFELDQAGEITYMNAAAEALEAPGHLGVFLRELDRLLVRGPGDRGARLVRELRIGDTWFELGIHQIAEFQLTRIYAQEISARKNAEAAAEDARRELERRVDERTRELADLNLDLEREVEIRRRAERDAHEASRSKSAFLANMSHELRTPLNAIIGYSELLREGRGADDWSSVDADLGRILGSARHLLGLINDVLDLSKIEAGKMQLSLDEIDLDALLLEISDSVRGLVAERSNELVDAWSAAKLGRARSDPQKLRQILLNLLSNAAKFTDNGQITLRAARRGPDLLIAVADTGIGIDRDAQERLFQPFVQVGVDPAHSRGGTGLGLAIAAEHARLLGGDLTLDSAPGRGSVFTVRLPVDGPIPP